MSQKMNVSGKAVLIVLVLLILPYPFLMNCFSQLQDVKNELIDANNRMGEFSELITQFQVYQNTLKASPEALSAGSKRVAYLTFDDGPGPYTDRLLDILKEKGVHATFFCIMRTGENNEKIYKRILDEGHSLAMHSTNHVYKQLYTSANNVYDDTLKLQKYIYDITGVTTKLYRFPGGTSNTVSPAGVIPGAIELLENNGFKIYDWNVASMDTEEKDPNKITTYIYDQMSKKTSGIILMHDIMEHTVNSVSDTIDKLTSLGCEFQIITEETPPLKHWQKK